ncbi:MAG: type I DNA topoisomerase [Bacteroidetes bacterium]|jgi:DNA topoisomerase I|nr:type I DNA topoisomerase [Bacteroidota bacterium]MBT6687029.1 type I DNA topoisomerase [Bacteroidota bacterium]MBT7145125.1 type I DNA topoisomerase [Bacteroidota bacterium]MBT7492548.1 type I DNA topoisomerase [Bacteroidota bacterium]
MEDNLVIVESPAKAKTIEKFLGKQFLVKSCFGHIRDLVKKDLGISVEDGFSPVYEVSPDKKKVVSELKKLSKPVKTVWLASDEDREGEAIAWHLVETLKLDEKKVKRIVFHEITKDAIQRAVKNPRGIDYNLVNAQQARRVLDRLVGFELSPVLWKKIKPALSAGRVQSVAVRLIVDREREISSFKSTSSYRVTAIFSISDNGKETEFKAELSQKFDTKEETIKFLKKCVNAQYFVKDVITKPAKKSPAPPFITSTLQQEASRKLGFSVSQTMSVAQKLYEAGKITYMRTDSVNLSDLAISTIKNEIEEKYGEQYLKIRKYKSKIKGAQEAHEAIRPSYINKHSVDGPNTEKRLYELIWKRTIASQMSDAKLEKTSATIDISTTKEDFIASGEVLKFDGFLKVYFESKDDETENGENGKTMLPILNVNDKLTNIVINGTQRFTHHPPRFTEASLVKKLEEQGIGRPSTYAPIISTVQNRGYVLKDVREGVKRDYCVLTMADKNLSENIKTETTGMEKAKLFPTDIGMVVNDFLVEHFKNIMNYNFTAKVEKQFDEIASGKMKWNKMIEDFYNPFHKKVESTTETATKNKGERLLGVDPKSGKNIYVKIGRYGPLAQIGEMTDEDKPKFAGLRKDQSIETITFEEVLELFKLPRNVGKYEEIDVTIGLGRFGPYIRHKSLFYSLVKDVDDPLTIELDRAIELIEDKREKDRKKVIKIFEEDLELKLLNGRWGPYVSFEKKNYRVPKKIDAATLSYQDCLDLIKNAPPPKTKRRK